MTAQAARESFSIVNHDHGFSVSRLDPVPRTFKGVVDAVDLAVVDPESVADVREHGGWEKLV